MTSNDPNFGPNETALPLLVGEDLPNNRFFHRRLANTTSRLFVFWDWSRRKLHSEWHFSVTSCLTFSLPDMNSWLISHLSMSTSYEIQQCHTRLGSYHLSVWSKFTHWYNSQWIAFQTLLSILLFLILTAFTYYIVFVLSLSTDIYTFNCDFISSYFCIIVYGSFILRCN